MFLDLCVLLYLHPQQVPDFTQEGVRNTGRAGPTLLDFVLHGPAALFRARALLAHVDLLTMGYNEYGMIMLTTEFSYLPSGLAGDSSHGKPFV